MVVINKIRVVSKGKGIKFSRVTPVVEQPIIEPARLRPIALIESDIININRRLQERQNERTTRGIQRLLNLLNVRDNLENELRNHPQGVIENDANSASFAFPTVATTVIPIEYQNNNRENNDNIPSIANPIPNSTLFQNRILIPINETSLEEERQEERRLLKQERNGTGIASSVNIPPVRTRDMIMNEIQNRITSLNWIRMNNPTNINITSMVTNIRNLIDEFNQHQDRMINDPELNLNDILYPPDIQQSAVINTPINQQMGRSSFDSNDSYRENRSGDGFSFKKRMVRIR